jgi:hypothetical protein
MNQKTHDLRGLRSTRECSSEQKNYKVERIGQYPPMSTDDDRVARASPRLRANISNENNVKPTGQKNDKAEWVGGYALMSTDGGWVDHTTSTKSNEKPTTTEETCNT